MSELSACPACRAPVPNGEWVVLGDQGHRYRPLCDPPDVERFQVHYATCARPGQLSRKAVAEAYQRTRKRVMKDL